MQTLDELLEEQIKDLYSAESQLLRALPKMAKAAATPELRQAVEDHLEETRTHVERLEQAAQQLDIKPKGKTCQGMKGLIEEGKEAIEENETSPVGDGAIIAAAQRVEHYEISGYGTARALARLLGHNEVADLFEQTLDEESATDEKLTQIAEQAVYPGAQQEEGEEGEEMEMAMAGGGNGSGSRRSSGSSRSGSRRSSGRNGGSSSRRRRS